MLLETLSEPFAFARAVNQTSNGYVAKVPTNAEPKGDAGTATGSSILEDEGFGATTQNAMVIVPFGTGANAQTFNFRVIGWRVIGRNNPQTLLWIPCVLCELTATLASSSPGVANTIIPATMLFANTLTVVTGNTNVAVDVTSPASAGTIAHATVSTKGFQKLELTFTTGGSATDCNALVANL